MSAALPSGLAWLPRPPDTFDRDCKALALDPVPGPIAARLAACAMDENQMARLGRAMRRAAEADRSLAPLIDVHLGVIGNATLDLFAPALTASAARHGLALDCVVADYGQIMQAALDPASRVNAAKPDAVLLALDHRVLPLDCRPGDTQAEGAAVAAAMAMLTDIRQAIRTHSGAVCIVQTVAPPPETLFGSADRLVPGSPIRVIDTLNRAIADSIPGSGDILLDVAGLAATIGLTAWHTPLLWNVAKLAFDTACLPHYADHVARLLAALRGRSRKCLVMDLDNTLWGGVIGDDGMDGIRLGQGDATGEAYLSVQRLALDLRGRGVLLAVSSKNTDAVARAVFRDHPEMLLREEHISVFQANWNDKATNLTAIARALSLGLDALVFLDDNPAERALVRRLLPQVAVPELGEDPALFARTLSAAGYFEAIAFSDEDAARADMYRANGARAAMGERTVDIGAYLASLDMEIAFAPFDAAGRARIAQLINKSNQFNLTTRRYTEAELAQAESDPAILTIQVRLVDRFGDNGMIGVVICRPGGPRTWVIDTWLMSCRVLGRGLEAMVLRALLEHAREQGIVTLEGIYRPTPRNALVAEHYPNLGFTLVSVSPDGVTIWRLPASAVPPPATMRVRPRQAAHASALASAAP